MNSRNGQTAISPAARRSLYFGTTLLFCSLLALFVYLSLLVDEFTEAFPAFMVADGVVCLVGVIFLIHSFSKD